MTNFINDYDWVLKNLESSKTKNQLYSVENLFELWKKKYNSKKFNKLKDKLTRQFFREFIRKDNTLWNK